MTPEIKNKIQTVVSVFETSSTKPLYDILVCLHDGPGKIEQITYGKHQTTEYGNLKTLIKMYCAAGGRYSEDLSNYIEFIGNPKHPLSRNATFKQLLKLAGTDYTMHEVQDKFFDQYYWNPAYEFFVQQGFTLPLSMLTIYDSYIQSGGILQKLRNRFGERTPINKGNEQRWITAYVQVRDKFLEFNPNEVVRNSDYRTDCLLECIKQGNWDLSQPVECHFNSNNKKMWVRIP